MTTLSIEDMKQKILKPSRASLNASTKTTSTTTTQATSDGPRGETHRSMEPGAVAYHPPPIVRSQNATSVPSQQTFPGGLTPLRIPKPSELFGMQSGLRGTPAASHGALQSFPTPTVLPTIPHLPAPGLLSAASVTRQREHDRRLRSLSTKMQRANLKRRLAANLVDPDEPSPVGDWMSRDIVGPHPTPSAPSIWGGLLTGIRHWTTTGRTTDADTTTTPMELDTSVHMEFDTDVVDALVYTVGRWLGLDTDQLRDSPGLRTLVSRNIQWFRSSPDWLKLAGLVMAKKLNQSLDCPRRSSAASDTQRMLLDRMLPEKDRDAAAETTTRSVEEEAQTVEMEAPTLGVVDPAESLASPPPSTMKRSQTKRKYKETKTESPAKRQKTKKKNPKDQMRPTNQPKTKRPTVSRLRIKIPPPPPPLLLVAPPGSSHQEVSLDTTLVEPKPGVVSVSPSNRIPTPSDLQPVLVEDTQPTLGQPQPVSHSDWESE